MKKLLLIFIIIIVASLKGEEVYETDDFADIKSTIPNITENVERGRIIDRKDCYLKLSCPVGRTIWVKNTSIIYPSVD